MEGMSEREYSAHSGLSRGAIQKARRASRLVVYSDGSINAAASDVRRADMTDPDQQRREARTSDEEHRPESHAPPALPWADVHDADCRCLARGRHLQFLSPVALGVSLDLAGPVVPRRERTRRSASST